MQEHDVIIYKKGDIVEFNDGEIRKVIVCDEEFAVLALFEAIPEGAEVRYHEDFEDLKVYSNNPFFLETTLIEVVAINGVKVDK